MVFIIGPAMAICVCLWICVAFSAEPSSAAPGGGSHINHPGQGGQSMGWYLTLLGSA
jgi:hypothetical protein